MKQMLSATQLNYLIHTHGFAVGYCVRPQPLGDIWAGIYKVRPPHTQDLCLDPCTEYPWATAVLLLVRAYAPINEAHIPGYYIASNEGYHAAAALNAALQAQGFLAQRLDVPIAALLKSAGLGRLLKNGVSALVPFGTRIIFYTIVTNACLPDAQSDTPPDPCGACTACVQACPAGAIHPQHGRTATRCVRAYMEGEPMPDWVMERLPGISGCEICQRACPLNAHIEARAPTAQEQSAFDLFRLVQGDIRDARALLGKNMCTRGRLTAQAAVLLALRGEVSARAQIELLCDHPQKTVAHAARWALSKL